MKRIILLIALLLSALLCLGSCFVTNLGNGEGEGGGENNEEEKSVENLIYDSSSTLYLIYDPVDISERCVNLLMEALVERGVYVVLDSHLSAEKEHEIVLGNVGRKVSDDAYVQLDRIEYNSESDMRFCIYSSGSSVAIAFDEDDNGFCAEAAISHFIDNYARESLTLAKGTVAKVSFDLYTYLGDKDIETQRKYWSSVSSKAGQSGEDIVSALQYLYSIYDTDGIVSWIADLYDPDICVCKNLYGEDECSNTALCHTGGFYFSNSARDTIGFLPDAESTIQALKYIAQSGLISGIGDSYSDLLPEEVNQAIKNFAYNLQDSDGFFYHPQWGTAIGTSRRARDYNWCISILNNYGVTPKYKTLSDVPSEDQVSYNELPGRLGQSCVFAVSKVVLADSETLIPDHLKSLDAFEDYLIRLDIKNNSYSAGNTLSAQSSQINSRGSAYGKLLISHLDAINIEYGNGTWHHTINYDAINGVMKISGVYSAFKATIPNAKKACLASFAAISSDEKVGSIVDIWNAWEALNRVMENIKKYGEPGLDVQIVNEILPDAADAIRATRDKLSIFCMSDGSFIYQGSGKTSGISMGAQVSVAGTAEGDMNATLIGSTNMVKSIFQSLKLGSIVPLAFSKERAVFLNKLSSVQPVHKTGTLDEASAPVSFDYYDEGEVPSEVRIFGSGSSKVVADQRDEDGKVLLFNSIKGSGDYFKLNTSGYKSSAVGMVFESELCFDESSDINDGLVRLELGDDGDGNVYRITFGTTETGITLWEHSSSSSSKDVKNKLTTVNYGQWFKLRVEYYVGDHDTVRIRVFIDDKLLCNSDNYFDQEGVKLSGEGKPGTALGVCRFYTLKNYVLNLYIDNIRSYYTKKNYQHEPLHEDYRDLPFALDVDRIFEDGVTYDFDDAEGENYPSGIFVDKNGGEANVVTSGNGKKLLVKGGATVNIPAVKTETSVNCDSVSFKITASDLTAGRLGMLTFIDSSGTNTSIFSFAMTMANEGGESYIKLLDGSGETVDGVRMSFAEENILRVDYYSKEGAAVIYVNNKRCAVVLINGVKNYVFGRVSITAESSILLDDISAERKESDFAEATAPAFDGKVYDFENGIDSDIKITGNGAAIENKGGDSVLKISGGQTTHTTLKIPVKERDEIMSYTELSFDISFQSFNKNGVYRKIAILDENEQTIVSFAMVISGGKAGISELTSVGVHSPMVEFSANGSAVLKFEYYENRGLTKVFVNGEYAFTSGLLYSDGSSILTPAFASVSTADVSAVTYLDDLCFERFNKLYVAEPKTANKENDATSITFNYSSGTDYPSKITYDINSGAPVPTVVEVARGEGADKALKFESYGDSHSMDELKIKTTMTSEVVNSYVFEADLMLENCSGGSTFFQIYLLNGSVGIVELSIGKSGNSICLYQKDYADNTTGEKIAICSEGEWFNLRIEYYAVTGGGQNKLRTKVFVNDELLFVSELAYKNATASGNLTTAGISALKNPTATIYIDNLSFGESETEYDGAEISYTVN